MTVTTCKACGETSDDLGCLRTDCPHPHNVLKYDDPMFNMGVTHTVELLAKALGITDWVAGDGSEDYDEDLQQTLMNIIEARGLYSSANGEWAALSAGKCEGKL